MPEEIETVVSRPYSNNVLLHKSGNKMTFYVPAFLRVNFKKMTDLDIQNADAFMSCGVMLTMYCKGLPD